MKELNTMQLLIDTAQTIADGRKNVQQTTGTIMESCYAPYTNGAAHKSLLLVYADCLKKLAELHSSEANWLHNEVSKLTNGTLED